MPPELQINLIEIAAPKRSRVASVEKNIRREAQAIHKAIPSGSRRIVLDEQGKSFTSMALSEKMQDWLMTGQDIALIIGGPDGLDRQIKQQADEQWSLSSMTLPHALVRVILLEQLYRAWSILQKHPYHRQ